MPKMPDPAPMVAVQWCDFCGTTAADFCQITHPTHIVRRMAYPFVEPVPAPPANADAEG